jgi:hypothetical protein
MISLRSNVRRVRFGRLHKAEAIVISDALGFLVGRHDKLAAAKAGEGFAEAACTRELDQIRLIGRDFET